MSIEDNDSKKLEQQKSEQQKTDKPKTGKDALDIVKAQKEGREVTQNLENSTEKPKTGKEALDIVKAQKEGKDVTQKLETSAEKPKTGKEALDIVAQERQALKAQKQEGISPNLGGMDDGGKGGKGENAQDIDLSKETLKVSGMKEDGNIGETNSENQKLPSETRWDKNWSDHLQNHPESAIRERFDTAYQFYQEAGFNHEQTLDHMKGINFNREVSVETVQSGEILKQYQPPENQQLGSYFTKEATKGELGVQGDYTGNHDRVPDLYVIKDDVNALKSTSADIDSWKGTGELYYGGGEQYYIAKTDIEKSLSRWDQSPNPTPETGKNEQQMESTKEKIKMAEGTILREQQKIAAEKANLTEPQDQHEITEAEDRKSKGNENAQDIDLTKEKIKMSEGVIQQEQQKLAAEKSRLSEQERQKQIDDLFRKGF